MLPKAKGKLESFILSLNDDQAETFVSLFKEIKPQYSGELGTQNAETADSSYVNFFTEKMKLPPEQAKIAYDMMNK